MTYTTIPNFSQTPIPDDDLEVRILRIIGNGRAFAALYKNARTDSRILDENVGAGNWTRDYKDVGGIIFCGIGIYDPSTDRFVTKWDTGYLSEKKDENREKAFASDAFKRAGTAWGIGVELYEIREIGVNLNEDEYRQIEGSNKFGGTWKLESKKWSVKTIRNEAGKITEVQIFDQNGGRRDSSRKGSAESMITTGAKTTAPNTAPTTTEVTNSPDVASTETKTTKKPWMNPGTKEWTQTIARLEAGTATLVDVQKHYGIGKKNQPALEEAERVGNAKKQQTT